MTSTLACFFREAPSSFRKLEEFPWLLCEGARFWLQSAQPSQYRAVWRPLRDCLVEMDLFQAMYCDQHVSDLHDYWYAMADVYDLVAEYRASLESFAVQSSSKGTNDRVVSLAHVAHLRTLIAAFFRDSARMDDAYAMYTEAVEVWRQCPGKQDRAAAAALERGELLLRWGKLDLAEEAIKEAIGDVETACGTESVPTNASAACRQMQPKDETRLGWVVGLTLPTRWAGVGLKCLAGHYFSPATLCDAARRSQRRRLTVRGLTRCSTMLCHRTPKKLRRSTRAARTLSGFCRSCWGSKERRSSATRVRCGSSLARLVHTIPSIAKPRSPLRPCTVLRASLRRLQHATRLSCP